ncbi:hypothetical protein IU474_06230 [Nocardia otitidiscaviarum]|uniref:hypothetical protein n=1 Tax=Nocardia otitidiscaviarum TaxID=1823 RepID=UPI0018933554|nr:hypothetical protein [Nocardia otitidiscaviarum]MBF6236674.1 hypothetical protein [Nocardia otitidiscaviarum]
MTRYLRRRSHDVAFCTVDRIMRELGVNGTVRGRKLRTTVPPKTGSAPVTGSIATSPPPHRIWCGSPISPTSRPGPAYVAFVFDAYSRAIVGWATAATKTSSLVSIALNMAV